MTSIRNQLICVNFGVSCWEGRRQDKKATKEVAESHGTASSVGRYHKDLLPGAAEHEAIVKIRNAWRQWHYEQTLPWGDNAARVMRSSAFLDYSQGYRGWQDKFVVARDAFLAAYPSLKADAELRLNTLFDAADYPGEEELRQRFSARLDVFPLPDAEDFRLLDGIPDDEAARLQAEAVAGLQTQVAEALRDLWQRMHGVVAAMASRLDIPHGEKGGKFHDSLIGNIEELLGCVPKLNLTGDPAIDAMTADMQALICQPETLRSQPDVRAEKAAQAKALAARMAQYVGE